MSAARAIEPGVKFIEMPRLLDEPAVAEFERQVSGWLLDPAVLHVFDFGQTYQLSPRFYRIISVYRRTLTKNRKYLCSINLRPELVVEISQMGLGDVFAPVENINKARELAGLAGPVAKAKPKIDSQVLNPFVEGTVNTLQVQANIAVSVGKPVIKDQSIADIAIAGVITLNNAQMPGSIVLCFPAATFLGVYEGMVGEKHAEISAEIQDAAAEILNMIYGHAKTKLKAQGFVIDMAIPVILVGEQLKMQIGEPGKSFLVPFSTPCGPFYLEIYFKKF